MSTALADPVTELGGLPFLDDSFEHARLLALVAALRHHEATSRGLTAVGAAPHDPTSWLIPGNALRLRPDRPPIAEVELTETRQQEVALVLDMLPAVVPSWGPLLRLPIRYLAHADDTAYSASLRTWPQHIFLSRRAFTARDQVISQVLHENCHQWLYLIQEAWDLQTRAEHDLTMPSGTTGRSLAEVLGGAHVAAALIRLYRTLSGQENRIDHLVTYSKGCLSTIDKHRDGLTPAGQAVAQRLEDL
ncbi:hypothetical protein [Nonomuraea sp. NPDC050202]|uniref:hypothetical protein n=1 Tax=Nonomuraea sp. NPDC050202 TaxID=3155035 RepID=UPI0033F3F6FD